MFNDADTLPANAANTVVLGEDLQLTGEVTSVTLGMEGVDDMPTTIIKHLQGRIAEIGSQIADLTKQLEGYKATLAWELQRDGHNGSHVTPADESTNKAGFIRDLIQKSESVGTTFQDIGQALEAAGIWTAQNYKYTLVSKWKQAGKVAEENGRLIWKGPGTSPPRGSGEAP